MAQEILIVDDEADIRVMVAELLQDEGYHTRTAKNSDEAFAELAARRPDLILLDIWLDRSAMDGMQILEAVHGEHPGLPIVMFSGHGTIETAVSAIRKGAYDFIEKPFKSDRLLLVVHNAIEAAKLRRENQELRERVVQETELIGSSSAVRALRQAITRVAPTGSRVLVTGPAGAGKEVVARQVHLNSKRVEGPMVVLNAATMTPDRVETELFGIEPGVLAPDSPRKVGVFEQAHRGTLFLDEVADMPLETQGKVVRVLHEQRFTRVGGSRPVDVDVRVIAATNRDLAAEIQAGRFREDLFYRLNVVPLRVPPLRERREDIVPLAQHFMQRAATLSGLPPRTLTEDALAALQTADWPGNVRQLRNVMEWLLIMAPSDPGSEIRADMLPPELVDGAPTVLRTHEDSEIMSLPLREAREAFERQYLKAQIARFDGNVSRTAAFVGMERSALHRKLKSLGLTGDGTRA